MKLDVGCGSNKKEDFLGVDLVKTEATDVFADATNLPFRTRSILAAKITKPEYWILITSLVKDPPFHYQCMAVEYYLV
jgi:hypothetical protein